jgi:DNA-binding response OmpR family regulator
MPRILVINPDRDHCSDVKLLLYLNGYQTETCSTLHEGLNRFAVFAELGRDFDLVLLIAGEDQVSELEQFENNLFFEKTIVVYEKRESEQGKKMTGEKIKYCEPGLVLDYVRHHLGK